MQAKSLIGDNSALVPVARKRASAHEPAPGVLWPALAFQRHSSGSLADRASAVQRKQADGEAPNLSEPSANDPTFPGYSGSGDQDITSAVPLDLMILITGTVGLQPDCADVSLLLRHYYLTAWKKTFTFHAGPGAGTTYTIGAGISPAVVQKCMVDLGSINFQEDRKGFRLVKFYESGGVPITNLKTLLTKGLQAGDLFVWKRLPSVSGNFEGHVQTLRGIDLAGRTIAFVQGNMVGGQGVGMLQQRQRTFAELTGVEDGNANILNATEVSVRRMPGLIYGARTAQFCGKSVSI